MIIRIFMCVFIIIDLGYFLHKHLENSKCGGIFTTEIIVVSFIRSIVLTGLITAGGFWNG